MIIKGNPVTGPQALARYLQSKEVNERAEIVEVRGTAALDPEGALIEMDAYAEGTRCQKPLYHAKINPEPPNLLTPEQRNEAIDLLEQKLGFTGHARVVVVHEKLGREHIHVIWSRIDIENMRAVPYSHNYRLHEEVARDLERRFGHPRVQGAHAERGDTPRPERTLSAAEMRQEERTGISAKNVKAEVTAAFKASDTAEAFCAALDDAGYILAKGDRRDFVIVDRAGGIHSLARRIDGMKAAELRNFMAPLDRESMPNIEEAQGIAEDRERGVFSSRDEMAWGDKLDAAALQTETLADAPRKRNHEDSIERDRQHDAAEKYARQWEDALAASAVERAKREEQQAEELKAWRRDAHEQALMEKDYAGGDGYVRQSEAALMDFEKRTEALADQATPFHPSDHTPPTPEQKFETAANDACERDPGLHQHPDRFDVLFGENADRVDENVIADRRHDDTAVLLYGEGGYENSEQRRQADDDARHAREENERRGDDSRTKDQPLGDRFERYDHVEMSEKLYERIQRMIDSPNASDVEHLEPDRQREAPGGGRTRGR